jgi:hypothetical protein
MQHDRAECVIGAVNGERDITLAGKLKMISFDLAGKISRSTVASSCLFPVGVHRPGRWENAAI